MTAHFSFASLGVRPVCPKPYISHIIDAQIDDSHTSILCSNIGDCSKLLHTRCLKLHDCRTYFVLQISACSRLFQTKWKQEATNNKQEARSKTQEAMNKKQET